MLTKKDIETIDDVEAGRKDIADTHLADAAAAPDEKTVREAQAQAAVDAHDVAAKDDGKSHIARDFGETIADILLPSSATHDAGDKK